jgi:RHS repeat-associated protein
LHSESFNPVANQQTTFTWDGQDAYGRILQGEQPAFVDLGYVYDATYEQTTAFAESGNGVQLSGNDARNEVTLHNTKTVNLGSFDARDQSLGGWSLNVHHVYDPKGRVLYQGDGKRRNAEGVSNIITTAATTGFFGDVCTSLAIGADGSFYYTDRSRLHKIDSDGNRTVIAGNGVNGYSGDGGPAVDAQVSFFARDVKFARDGSIIYYEGNGGVNRIRRIDPEGMISTIVGNGLATHIDPPADGTPGPEFPVIDAIPRPAPDGSLYFSDVGRLWRLGLDGRVREVKMDFSADDAGPATGFKIADIAVGTDGSVYIMDTGLVFGNALIRKLTPDGKIHLLAGKPGIPGSSGDGGPALAASVLPNTNGGITVSQSGDVYFNENVNVIRKISTDGIISQYAGNRIQGYEGDGGPATQARVGCANALALGPDGALYIADGHIRRVGSPLPGYDANDLNIPSEDGSELFVFDASGKHLRTVNTLTGATVLSFAYDSAGRLISVTDGDNNVTTIERDSFGNPTGIVSPYNQRTQLNVNGNGYVSSISNPANETERFTYSSAGLLLSKKDAANASTSFVYDELGRLISDKNALNNLQVLTKTGEDNDYTVQHQTPLGRKTDYRVQYANDGSLTNTVTAPDGTQSVSSEGANGINQSSDAEGTTSSETLTGDPRWNMQAPYAKSATLRSGGLTATASNNIVASLSDPANLLSLTALTETSTFNNRTYTSHYLASNKTLTNTSPLGRIAKTQIDNLGRPVLMQVSGLLDTQASYDSRGRLSSISSGADSEQRTTTITYNSAGYVSDITDAMGRVEAFAYDAAGRITQQTLTDGRQIAFSYDSRGNLTGITPPGRPKHSFSFDALNQNDSYTPPVISNGGGTQYVYDKDRQLSQITRPDNHPLSLVYDTAGRLDTLKTPLGDYGYDYHPTTGQLTQLTSPTTGKLEFSYNGALLTGVTFSGEVAGSVGYGYDNDFRVNEISVNAANPVSYGYDNDSLLTQVGDLQFSRNSQNGLVTGSTLGVVTDSRSFNGFAETTLYQANINSDNGYKAEYSYDKLGRITQKIETLLDAVPVTYVYSYDTAGRLSQVNKGNEQTSYGYDSNGNRIRVNGATVGSYDDQDRLTNYNGTTYAYTANGELQSKTKGGGTTNYQYDVMGNLRQVSFANGDKIDYSIDAADRRVGRKATINGVIMEQRFLYQDDLKIIAELDANNTVISRFVYGSRVNVPDYMIKDGNTYRLITDHLGSPRIVINTATGAIAQRMDYDAWGKVLSDTNSGFQPFGFAGGLYDKQTGLVRFGVRDYEVDTGRWTTKDPIDFAGKSTNLYEYVNNDPQNNIDFDGYESFKDKIVDWAKGKAIDWATDSIVDPLDKLGKWMDHGRENPLRKKYLKKFLDIRSAKDLGNMICDLKNLIDEQTERQKQADEEHLKRLAEKLKKVYEANKASDRLRYQRQGLPYPNK